MASLKISRHAIMSVKALNVLSLRLIFKVIVHLDGGGQYMKRNAEDVRLGRFLSLVLRHNPQAAGIVLDAHGWADVEELLAGVRGTGRRIDMDTLERIVRENNKQRYSFNDDHKGKI